MQAETDRQGAPALTIPGRRMLRAEVVIVFALSLGYSGVHALLDFLGALTARKSLASQPAVLNGAQTHGRNLLELSYQLLDIAAGLAPVALVLYLLYRSGESAADIGLDTRRPRRDLLLGFGLAAAIGLPGLGLYLLAHALGVNLSIVATNLPAFWWRTPVLVLSAFQNAALEEVLVVGYLLRRLDQLGLRLLPALLVSATVRGSYHLYQGLGGFFGNMVMGLIFGGLYLRTRRLAPLVIAHTTIDAVAFVGYTLLHGHVSWLP
jgi:membrane protease YdiL (CAAX protease family)